MSEANFAEVTAMFLRRLSVAISLAIVCAVLAPIAVARTREAVASPAATQGYQDQFITVNGLEIHYLDWGAKGKQPLIMLHGISRVAHSYDSIAPLFNANYHVIAMDLRGHGDSGWSPEGAYLVEDMVKDLEGLMDQLKLRNVVLLGSSTGGRVAQVYAGMHPDRVARLIVEDVGPQRTTDIADSFARQVKAEENGWSSEDELVASLMKTDKRTPEAEQRNYAHFATKRREDGRIVWKRDPNLVKGFIPTDLWLYVAKINCPTIYILGGMSNIVPPATQEQLKKTLPKVQIVVVPGTGHYPHLEAQDSFLKIVNSFLQGSA
jgi:esterase